MDKYLRSELLTFAHCYHDYFGDIPVPMILA